MLMKCVLCEERLLERNGRLYCPRCAASWWPETECEVVEAQPVRSMLTGEVIGETKPMGAMVPCCPRCLRKLSPGEECACDEPPEYPHACDATTFERDWLDNWRCSKCGARISGKEYIVRFVASPRSKARELLEAYLEKCAQHIGLTRFNSDEDDEPADAPDEDDDDDDDSEEPEEEPDTDGEEIAATPMTYSQVAEDVVRGISRPRAYEAKRSLHECPVWMFAGGHLHEATWWCIECGREWSFSEFVSYAGRGAFAAWKIRQMMEDLVAAGGYDTPETRRELARYLGRVVDAMSEGLCALDGNQTAGDVAGHAFAGSACKCWACRERQMRERP